jgi:outer membrane cobalamin receptor
MRNIHFPTLSQLYLRNTNNPNLQTETVYQYQVGLEQKLPLKSFFKVNAFYSDIHDVIGLKENVTPQEGYAPYHVNFSHYEFYGFETSLETSAAKGLHMKGAYTLNASRDYSRDDRQEVQYVPKHKFVFKGRYDFPFGLTPFLSVVYVAESFVYSKQQYVTVMKAQMADYIVVNFKLSQKLFKDTLSIYAGADNLLNKDYEDTYGIPRPGRYVYGGFEYRF